MVVTTQRANPAVSPRLTLAVMCAGMFLVLLDVTVVNVALPSISTGLGGGVAGAQWVVDAYAVAIASVLLAAGSLGDRIGHRRIVLVGLVLFGVASAGCALAPGMGVLVGCRGLQGLGAALLLPGTLAVITRVYPDPGARARALGVWAAVSSLALPVGPLLGGQLVGTAGWRAIFAINLPIVAGAVVAVPRVVPALPGGSRERIELGGLSAVVAMLAAVVFAVIEAGRVGLNLPVVVALIVAAAGTVGLWASQRRSASPILPPALLRDRQFAAANVVALLMNLCINGTLFVLTLYLQQLGRNSPQAAGLMVLPMALPLVALAPVAGRMAARFGPPVPMVCGTALAAGGAICLLQTDFAGDALAVLPVMLGEGCGAGLLTTAAVAAAVGAAPSHQSGLASGVNNTARQVGTALGVAIFGAVAGSPATPAVFVAGLHHLAVLATTLWVVAIALSLLARRPQLQ